MGRSLMKIKYLNCSAASNNPKETESVLLYSNFFFLSLYIHLLLLLALTFDVIYIMDFVHHRHLLNMYLSALAGVGAVFFWGGLDICWTVAEWCMQVKGVNHFFISCLIFFATTEHSSDLCLLKQSTGRFKATFCAQQTAQLGDRGSENAKLCTFRGTISFPLTL